MAVPKEKVQKLKYLRIKETDGTIYGDVPLAIDAENVTMENQKDLQNTIGDINYETQGDITTNLRRLKQDKVDKVDLNDINIAIQQIQQDMQLKQVNVRFNTTSGWNSQPSYRTEENTIYIYTDYQVDEDGNYLAGIKVGDGGSLLIDKPFLDQLYLQHIYDRSCHITQEEREFWNNKVRCYYSEIEDGTIIFTTH